MWMGAKVAVSWIIIQFFLSRCHKENFMYEQMFFFCCLSISILYFVVLSVIGVALAFTQSCLAYIKLKIIIKKAGTKWTQNEWTNECVPLNYFIFSFFSAASNKGERIHEFVLVELANEHSCSCLFVCFCVEKRATNGTNACCAFTINSNHRLKQISALRVFSSVFVAFSFANSHTHIQKKKPWANCVRVATTQISLCKLIHTHTCVCVFTVKA